VGVGVGEGVGPGGGVAVGAGVGVGVGVGPENASSAMVNRIETEIRISNAERSMQNSFRGTTQLLITMRAAESGIALGFTADMTLSQAITTDNFSLRFRAGVTVILPPGERRATANRRSLLFLLLVSASPSIVGTASA
jgi:hypothetical protein